MNFRAAWPAVERPRLRIAATLTLVACGIAFGPAPSLADPPGAVAASGAAGFGDDNELAARLDGSGRLIVAGERMHGKLLRRFYAGHGYRTVWGRYPDAAAALTRAVLNARSQALDPGLYHGYVLSAGAAALPPVERDLLLSDAVLSYADALSRGAVPVEDRADDQDLTPEPVDIVAALDAAIAAPDPATTIEALAPASDDYQVMRQAYAGYRAIAEGNGRFGRRERGRGPRDSPATVQRRMRELAVNLERLRWMPREIPADRLVVDTAGEILQLFRRNQPVFTSRIVVGEFDKQTPELQSEVTGILFNPPWNIPRSIFDKEIGPRLAQDRHYLEEHHMRYRGPRAVQQEAGPYSALGRLKFEMSDRYDVYLHDTPERWRFHAASRMMSHGCVRVEYPRALAALLLGEGPQAIDQAIDAGRTHRQLLPKPLPVFIVYRTAYVEPDGSIGFRADPYRRDDRIWQYLIRSPQPPIAQDAMSSQRKG